MNYIEEELQRQRAALTSLLQGQTNLQETADTANSTARQPAADDSASQRFQQPEQTEPEAVQNLRTHVLLPEGSLPAAISAARTAETLRTDGTASLLIQEQTANAETAASASEISRAVELDARRYDGAYLLY